jgi:hypothetical protein
MDDREVQETLTAMLVGPLTVDPGRAVGLAPETAPPTEVGGGLGLDSPLDVRELSLRIESRGGPTIEEREARAPLLPSLGRPTGGPDGVARRRVA